MPLTNTACKSAKPGPKARRLFDERGLYLEISPAGGKWWRFKYRFEGREKRLSLGVYPEVPLAEAREKRDVARKLIAQGIDPAAVRKAEKSESVEQTNTFEAVAREWHAKFSPSWVVSHSGRILRRLEKDVFPWIGSRPIREIMAPELLETLRRIEARGALETAHRALQNCGQVFRYAVATGRADRDPSGDLRGALPPPNKKHHASLTDPKDIAALLRSLDSYSGHHVTRCALKLAPLVFVRPGELRHAEWSEIDFEAAEWRIPSLKMKAREKHIVPLSRQAVAVLREIQPLTGAGRYVFPSARSKARPMSENAVTAALRRMGYTSDEMTGHGFRSLACSALNEAGWHKDAIERQMAHAERNSVRAAYNFAEHLPERRRMMQAWADFLDELKAGGKVIPLHREQAG
ncbi:protein of unknown function DUF4102 [Alkalidesulfovibrio alkalitolerans DSM 16529]|uniref:Tyr recombinase domain-containing protein n=1 Tax=Alkalidesulfovibrio alkalitolerans DSM 16529 TaxID=1121439 RepID=S7T1G7_9BACT|nr:integrase arm-type DNA-binding domain-containing protein [Alkalidesulfovibrio alkalitolerans]EPR30386.1 protein of unknown function DUF4102 [Alkalidesulfovibrio alkalitolerans DSM 16529]